MQFYDFHPDVGLIVAGAHNPSSKKVELSTNYGQSKTSLPDIPYGSGWNHGACLVIVDSTTVFVAGGRSKYSMLGSFNNTSQQTNSMSSYA